MSYKHQLFYQPHYSLAWPNCFFHYLWWQKNGKTRSGHARLHARVAMEGGLLNVWVSHSVNHSQSMDIATFSTLDLREQGRKSYVASYRANEQLVIPQMFSRELCQWRWFAKDFFHERFPIYSIWVLAFLWSKVSKCYIHTHIHKYVDTYIHTYRHTYVCMHVDVHTAHMCMYAEYAHIHTYICMYT